jgi:predicted nucleic acid-binding protein
MGEIRLLTAIDSSILIDILFEDATHSKLSYEALGAALELGPVIACPIVWSEVRSAFDNSATMREQFSAANIRFDPFDETCAERAGALWRSYRKNGGTRDRIVSDFFIGAHAELRGGRLLTRDRGFFRRYFENLTILGPIEQQPRES